MRMKDDDFFRFFDKVLIGDDCWEWQAGKSANGYGAFRLHGKTVGAHQASFWHFYGEPAEGEFVCHSCDNPICVNPTHLRGDSPKSNTADAVARGRLPRGSAHGNARLTEGQVKEIRSRSAEPQEDLAMEYGVSRQQINRIINGKRWAHSE